MKRAVVVVAVLFVTAWLATSCGAGPRPSISQVLPASITNGSDQLVLIIGDGFRDGLQAQIGPAQPSRTTFVNEQTIALVVPKALTPGIYDIGVVDPGGASAVARRVLQIHPTP